MAGYPWILIYSPTGSRMYRTRTPGGWLVSIKDNITVIDDPSHEWVAPTYDPYFQGDDAGDPPEAVPAEPPVTVKPSVPANYLKSKEWRQIRFKVLERDSHICQGCHDAEATHVHHLTYAHFGAELMFELMSVCSPCHAKAHTKEAAKQAA